MSKTLVLVLNCGSSSLKFSILDPVYNKRYLFGLVERLYTLHAYVKWYINDQKYQKIIGNDVSHIDALKFIIQVIFSKYSNLIANVKYIGHRVVHGGNQLTKSVIITDTIMQEIKKNKIFAPLHNPINLLGIQASIQYFPVLSKKNVAVFDTALYYHLPEFSYLYAIPYKFYKNYHIRRYGAHGISHSYVSKKASSILNINFNHFNTITCHLGGGASISVIRNGICIDTSMGLTPLEGLVMGTRSGDIDPSVVFFMYNVLGFSMCDIQNMFINQSGILGLTNGITSDFRDIEKQYYSDIASYRAINIFCYRLSKYIGAYAAILNGKLDALVFTGGIGENSALVRELTLSKLSLLGISIDSNLNYAKCTDQYYINKKNTIPILVIPTDEELVIAQETIKLFT